MNKASPINAKMIMWPLYYYRCVNELSCINRLKALVQIILYPSHATQVCPKCDVGGST